MTASSLRRRLPILVVLAIVAAGLAMFALSHWRRGSVLFGAAALVAGGLRLFVPEDKVGVLAVRSRTFDVTFLLLLAAGFITLVLADE